MYPRISRSAALRRRDHPRLNQRIPRPRRTVRRRQSRSQRRLLRDLPTRNTELFDSFCRNFTELRPRRHELHRDLHWPRQPTRPAPLLNFPSFPKFFSQRPPREFEHSIPVRDFFGHRHQKSELHTLQFWRHRHLFKPSIQHRPRLSPRHLPHWPILRHFHDNLLLC